MLNFISRDQHRVPVLLIKAWAFWSLVAPVAMTAACVLLLVGLATLVGAPAEKIAWDFLVEVQEPLGQLSVQLWFTAFLMMVVCYGVSAPLIRRTTGRPLSAPLAALAARLQFLSTLWASFRGCGAATISPPALPALLLGPYTGSRPLPVSLTAGTAPLLE